MAEQPVIKEWETGVRAALKQVEGIVTEITRLSLISGSNAARVDAVIAATPASEIVPGTTFTREQALAYMAMFQSFGVWSATPITVDVQPEPDLALPPTAIIFWRDS